MDVFCEICGHPYDSRDPGVRFLNVDRAWTCADEGLCFDRRAMQLLDKETSREG
jgi:rubredoxin